MSKIGLATRLADELAVTVDEASRFVDEIGADRASKVVDDIEQGGDSAVAGWVKNNPRLAAGGTGAGLIGGGALAWRQQDVAKAQALAEQSGNYKDAVSNVLKSDLPKDMKRELVDDASNAAGGGGGSSRNNGNSQDDGGLIPDDPQTLIILIIVMAIVLKVSLEGDE